jgi:hypothetical protein
VNEAHQRFREWLTAGAEGDPARDVAVHASLCTECRRSIAALDLLAMVNPGVASMPAEPTGREWGRLAMAGRLAGATAVLFSAAILGVGVSQLIGVSHTNGPVAQASQSPEQNVLGATATPQPSEGATPTAAQETLTPLGTPEPSPEPPVAPPVPYVPPPPTPIPTAVPTPIVVPSDTPLPSSTAIPTPAPSVPAAITDLGASSGTTPGEINLTWSAPIDDGGSPITSYRIYRGTTSGGEIFLTEISPQTSYVDLSAATGPNWYLVMAVNAIGEGPVSNEATATAL